MTYTFCYLGYELAMEAGQSVTYDKLPRLSLLKLYLTGTKLIYEIAIFHSINWETW